MCFGSTVSVSDTLGRYAAAAKQETGAAEKVTDCGFVSAIKSGTHLFPLDALISLKTKFSSILYFQNIRRRGEERKCVEVDDVLRRLSSSRGGAGG